jgi:hypothetical protein
MIAVFMRVCARGCSSGKHCTTSTHQTEIWGTSSRSVKCGNEESDDDDDDGDGDDEGDGDDDGDEDSDSNSSHYKKQPAAIGNVALQCRHAG